MAIIFPSQEWMDGLKEKLNSDARYAQIARNWEGDLCINIAAGGALMSPMILYFDLWHGTCREAGIIPELGERKPVFVLDATFENITRILQGGLDPMQAMMTRKLHVQGSMSYMMRNVPTVLDFVRCAREVTTEILS
jgi:putative sterol carrier protein